MADDVTLSVPDVLAASDSWKRVRPIRELHGEPTGMIRDFLAGELAAGGALLDWLRERQDHDERRTQLREFSRLLRGLIGTAVHRAHAADVTVEGSPAWHSFAWQVSQDWEHVRRQTLVIFAFDVWVVDDAFRFAAEVMQPGKLGGYGAGVWVGGEREGG